MEALVGCAGVTMKVVATAMRMPLERCRIVAEGLWDARGTLAVERGAPVGLTGIRLRFEIESTAAPERVKKLVSLTERYCVILQTLMNPPTIEKELRLGQTDVVM